jgi:hypothetical protein
MDNFPIGGIIGWPEHAPIPEKWLPCGHSYLRSEYPELEKMFPRVLIIEDVEAPVLQSTANELGNRIVIHKESGTMYVSNQNQVLKIVDDVITPISGLLSHVMGVGVNQNNGDVWVVYGDPTSTISVIRGGSSVPEHIANIAPNATDVVVADDGTVYIASYSTGLIRYTEQEKTIVSTPVKPTSVDMYDNKTIISNDLSNVTYIKDGDDDWELFANVGYHQLQLCSSGDIFAAGDSGLFWYSFGNTTPVQLNTISGRWWGVELDEESYDLYATLNDGGLYKLTTIAPTKDKEMFYVPERADFCIIRALK